jgi:hypothetical protein
VHTCVDCGEQPIGDLDGDGLVSAADCLLLAQHLAGNVGAMAGMDLNRDDAVDILDLAFLMNLAVGSFKE